MDAHQKLSITADLVAIYRAKFREHDYSGMWKDFFEKYHRPLHDVFMRGSVEQAAAIISDPNSNFLHFGFDDNVKGGRPEKTQDPASLRSLSVALGAERTPNPEQPLSAPADSTDEILARIDKVRPDVDFPNPFPGEGGVITSRGLASFRAIHAIYQASLLKGRVLEVGGGLGRVAYYANRFGIKDYTIVDLPFTGISQGYFLGATLGAHCVKLMSPDEFFASRETYDVALNVDSITELGREMAVRYIEAIMQRSRRFISINHEANPFTVREIGGPGERYPYWLRPGYVQEHFSRHP